jgi:outer membrane protein assembly factor BamB
MTQYTWSILLAAVLALAAFAAPPPNAVYTLTVAKGGAGGKDVTVKLVTLNYGPERIEVDGVSATIDKYGEDGIKKLLVFGGDRDRGFDLMLEFGEKTITGRGLPYAPVTGTWQARDTLPFGDRDFYPSPTNAVGFAGQGRNWYPGATPPTQFWEGTPVAGGKEPAYADQMPKNVLWKRPHPGWGDALPVVIGDRVITLHSPHYVVCWDANTGGILWQDELKAMSLPMLAADRKTLAPAPEAAAKRQALFEAGLAYYRLSTGISPGKKTPLSAQNMASRRPMISEAITVLEGWKRAFGKDFPDIPAAIDQTLDGPLGLKTILAAIEANSFEAVNKAKGGAVGIPSAFAGQVERTVGIRLGNCWPGHVGDVMATPVSDGAIVGVTFGHGQVAAYEVMTGKRLWAFRDPTMNAFSVSHAPSPLLWKDLLIVAAGGAGGGRPSLLALDTQTGAARWESPGGEGGTPIGASHGDHMSHYLHRMPDGKGGVRALVITNKGAVLDAETGKTYISKLPGLTGPNQGLWGSGFISGTGDLIFKTWGGDCSAPPCETWQLKVTGPDTVEAIQRAPIMASNSHASFALSDTTLVLNRRLVDPSTGGWQTGKTDRKAVDVAGGTSAIAGKYLIQATDTAGDSARTRADRMALATFTLVDISDPANPRALPGVNLLGGADMPPDILDKFFPATAADPALKVHTLGCYHGLPSWFGVRMGGVTAHGNRLFILSNSHLYCIGEKE